MSKFFHLSKAKTKKNNHRKAIPAMKMNVKTINIVIGVFIAVTAVSYLVQINGLATKGYQIKELESKITELEQDSADLELESLSLQSMGAVKDKVDELGLVAVGEIDYLQPTPVAMAR